LMGAGSQRLAEQVAKTWPRARVRRVDPDAPASAATDAPDIYVTTWIGTKAVLRPPVSLVAVLDADALIRRPDFRAAEHAYQALAEMAEWAGPARTGGRLLVQCSEPAHHAIQAVARADYRFFMERELEQRAELAYPPFGELVTARATGSGTRELLDQVAARCRTLGATVLGPIPSPPATPGGLELLVKCVDAQRVARDLRGILALVPPGSRLRVDVDPR
jgi:primosomal protein N' (replication factor Y) (superfamily II helicase)